MSPKGSNAKPNTKALDSAVRKLEQKEAKAEAQGKGGGPVGAVGRQIHQGRVENA